MAKASLQRSSSHTDMGAPASPVAPSDTSLLAAKIKALVIAGKPDAARDRFSGLVQLQQRRAARIAYHYLRDAHDADEAVQDAFVKVFTHIVGYREELPFEVWFTRILVNGCLDLRKARSRRLRWVVPTVDDAPPPASRWRRSLAPRTSYWRANAGVTLPLPWPGCHCASARCLRCAKWPGLVLER